MARKIDTEAVINWERLAQQGSNPASPAAGYWYLFIKSDGLYIKDSGGNVMGPIRGMANSTLWDAAGDLAQGTGADTGARLAIGTANQILRVNAGATAVEWANLSRVLISEQTPTGTGTVTWSSIPATYNSLEIEYVCDTDASSVTSTSIRMYFNNDTTATNYRSSLHFAYGTNSSVTVGADTASIVNVTGASSPANHCGRGHIKIIGYAGTTYYKESQGLFSYREDATTNHEVSGRSGHNWENTGAVNRVDLVTLTGNYLAGTVFRLYGVY